SSAPVYLSATPKPRASRMCTPRSSTPSMSKATGTWISPREARLNITDPIRLLNYMFLGQGEVPCLDAADANNDGEADISDAIFIMSYNFARGRPPPSPGPPARAACGKDPEGGDLGCASYTGCGDFGN